MNPFLNVFNEPKTPKTSSNNEWLPAQMVTDCSDLTFRHVMMNIRKGKQVSAASKLRSPVAPVRSRLSMGSEAQV